MASLSVLPPARIIQFGTGVLLRGLVDHAIHQANQSGCFMGSVVQIKSTAHGNGDEFAAQDNLYTVAIRGFQDGQLQQQYLLNGSIGHTLNANSQWQEVLQLAHDEPIDIIVSNTTEVGIAFDEQDDYRNEPPASFPGKLLALLHRRFEACEGNTGKGFTIIPTELVSNNGALLKAVVLQMAAANGCGQAFVQWINEACTFCNSLVDRIVTGKPSADKLAEHWEQLGYHDDLLIECEPYLLWAIEGDEKVQQVLGFGNRVPGVVIAPSIEKYKELKLRLLNGTHTFLCGMAFLKGFVHVRDAIRDDVFKDFLKTMMLEEIAPTLPYPQPEREAYALSVIDRFANPFIDHRWHNISLNYTQKMVLRNLETIQRYYDRQKQLPQKMAICFAWYLHFMTPVAKNEKGQWYGMANGEAYLINDPEAERFYQLHQQYSDARYVEAVLQHTTLWGSFSFTNLPGFISAVITHYITIGSTLQ
jgi:tagaturonate reductase